ncbi:MAG: IS110 family transposase [Bacteroides thetaiotaomicron]|jgi:hypothetical protein
MDVHKDLIVATIATTNQDNITTYLQRSFTSQNPDLFKLKNWLKDNNCYDVAMESTGKYWIPIFNVLEDEINVGIVHPKYTKAIKGKKTDKKDSKWIADLFKHDLLKFSFIPPKEIRELRELSRYRIKLVNMRSSERNRYQNCMTVSNIGLASVLTDVFGKSSKAIMKEVLTSAIIDDKKIISLLNKKAKDKATQVLDSLKDSRIENDQRMKMNISYNHIEELDKHIQDLEVEMTKRILPYFDQFKNILEIPGISFVSAIIIVSEIGLDMTQFDSDKQLCSWAGLAPANNESANKKKSVRISKAGIYLKPLLVQCALSAIKSNTQPYYKVKYERIKKRRGHKKAIIAIARMILTSIYHIILTGEVFNPSDIDTYNKTKSFKKELTPELALKFLQESGYDISSISIN